MWTPRQCKDVLHLVVSCRVKKLCAHPRAPLCAALRVMLFCVGSWPAGRIPAFMKNECLLGTDLNNTYLSPSISWASTSSKLQVKTFEVTAACKYEIGDSIAGTNIWDAIILAIHVFTLCLCFIWRHLLRKTLCVLNDVFSWFCLVAFDRRNVATCMALVGWSCDTQTWNYHLRVSFFGDTKRQEKVTFFDVRGTGMHRVLIWRGWSWDFCALESWHLVFKQSCSICRC